MKKVITLLLGLIMAGSLWAESLTIYSGRNENLIGPLVEKFKSESGIDVHIRYGKTAQMAATILEEGKKSPADVFLAQDAGALGAVSKAGLLQALPEKILAKVATRFKAKNNNWVGISGRAFVVVYNTDKVKPEDLPKTIEGFTAPEFKNRMGWAPGNGSFQAFVTAYRKVHGDAAAESWLKGIDANATKQYPKNTPILAATGKAEIDLGFANHYYLYRFKAEQGEDFPVAIYLIPEGEIGPLVNTAGASILKTARNKAAAEKFINYLLSEDAQKYFAESTYEYALAFPELSDSRLPTLDSIRTPDLDLSDIDDLEGTLILLQKAGIL